MEYAARSSSSSDSYSSGAGMYTVCTVPSGMRGITVCARCTSLSLSTRGTTSSVCERCTSTCVSSPSSRGIRGEFPYNALALLVFALGATVGARLAFGSTFSPRLTWLSDFLGFGTPNRDCLFPGAASLSENALGGTCVFCLGTGGTSAAAACAADTDESLAFEGLRAATLGMGIGLEITFPRIPDVVFADFCSLFRNSLRLPARLRLLSRTFVSESDSTYRTCALGVGAVV